MKKLKVKTNFVKYTFVNGRLMVIKEDENELQASGQQKHRSEGETASKQDVRE